MKTQRLEHTVKPLYHEDSRILILGSFPSAKSREGNFFYHHPQNRFWKVLAGVFAWDIPKTIEEKTALLVQNKIAVWDVIASCDITGSSDSSIRNVVPNDLRPILEAADIRQIYCTGGTAFRLYNRYCKADLNREAIKLPSTSPANAAYSVERLIEEWSVMNSII